VKYIEELGPIKAHDSPCAFDFDLLSEDIFEVVRAMDNVVDRANYPLPEQRQEALSKRRMGLGITGLANTAERLGYSYGSPEFLRFEAEVLEHLTIQCYMTSALLAKEKGPFPLFKKELYLYGEFVKRLPPEVLELIEEYGIRNSHLTSIAPTGTISITADNVSSGIEPVFSYRTERTVINFDGPETQVIEDYGVRVFGVKGKRASEVTAKEHLLVLETASKYVDSAISKTCNVSGSMPWDEFKDIYMHAWLADCKGITTYNTDGKRGAVLVEKEDDVADSDTILSAEEEPGSSCYIDPVTGRHECE
jgi:ribonucleoside-diphosphate reductase alpha chain